MGVKHSSLRKDCENSSLSLIMSYETYILHKAREIKSSTTFIFKHVITAKLVERT